MHKLKMNCTLTYWVLDLLSAIDLQHLPVGYRHAVEATDHLTTCILQLRFSPFCRGALLPLLRVCFPGQIHIYH